MSKEDVLHGYCDVTVIQKRGGAAEEMNCLKENQIGRQSKSKAQRENKYTWSVKGKTRTMPTTTCKEKTNAEHARNRTVKAKSRSPLVF